MLPKNLEPFIEPIIAMAESQFPRICACCNQSYANFKQFIELTKPVGAPTAMRATTEDPMEVITWTNCACGSTLILSCAAGNTMHAQFMRVLEEEAKATGQSVGNQLVAIRKAVRARMLKGR